MKQVRTAQVGRQESFSKQFVFPIMPDCLLAFLGVQLACGTSGIREHPCRLCWGYQEQHETVCSCDGIWLDTIYATLAGTTPAVTDSIVAIYGTIAGSYTYTSTANYKITLPRIDAKYVDVQ